MRIIGGKFKGKLIQFLRVGKTRPLKDSVKENIFNILNHSNEINIKIGYFSTFAALISAGGGASVGQYGPLVHFGATLGTSIRLLTKNILIANKESIVCGWHLILNRLKKYKTSFIPLDSEHFSIWNLIKNENINDVEKIVLTASGGPFLNLSNSKISNIHPKFALKHPNWKMGKKISIDSSTMMNKIFEFIEAKVVFNVPNAVRILSNTCFISVCLVSLELFEVSILSSFVLVVDACVSTLSILVCVIP